MTDQVTAKRRERLRTCFLNRDDRSASKTRSTVIGQNPNHEEALVRQLVVDYGWTLGADLELLPSDAFFRRVSA